MEKLSYELNGEWVDYSHQAEYELQENRIALGLSSGGIHLVSNLVNLLEGPLYILYVLHTSRGEGELGRYQSPELEKEEVLSFISEYSSYLSSDSRFDIWFYSPAMKATIVWDRHNLVFVYGLATAEAEIIKYKYNKGYPQINFPHQHHYRKEFDSFALSLLEKFNWVYSPLKQADVQGV